MMATPPHGFGPIPLKYLASKIGSGKTPKGGAEAYSESGVLFLRSQNVHFDGLRLEDVAFIDQATDEEMSTTRVQVDDVLLNITGASLGRVTRFPKGVGDANVNQHVCIVRPQLNVDARFIAYALASVPVQQQISTMQVGGNREGLNFEQVGNLLVPDADWSEQRRISDFLDVEVSRIDRLVSAKKRASNLIDERRVALTTHLCLRGVSGDGPLKDSWAGPIGAIPRHWRVTRNKNLLTEVVDLSEDGCEELLTVSHLTGVTPRREKSVYMFMAESTAGYKRCQPNDLVINTLWAWMGALGVSRHAGIVSPAYGVYRFTSDEAYPEYFDRLYRTPAYVSEMTRYSRGVWTSRLRLYPESFLALSVPVPPRREQEEIVRSLDRELEPEVRTQSKIERSNGLLAERRQALITAAVTGQLDVSTASGRGIEE
ncbi:restriction endonuclease subunit S [Streptomyces sp. ISL-22]|uniref:restriction endonuclease subunit S n=1 Tax=unclassified Streptomyces TaxID=2593676 RepID=UPI001BEC0DA7|nr:MULTISPECIES: restriction endonuclease subunit S [unclassified Streptomyces]MBT2418039.1 restriction endonuclease subunit S [Streptomyces sp. ISL-24]MBT2432286.1 restriction endonuclease subunit S [Streptomyces sp. ISL-22]